ncbi:Ribokinase-like protein [Sporormia fimetaria CBS 119925]|uniref:Ribokinase-like protein n=1 Tax=Sporormia fimetaria CBS 119925 TaxID=1340428 RepID=A0A6A6VAM1_9PLEO|nr:Ribokinase-like protein [Sporormia fimetaria CBS 119925]
MASIVGVGAVYLDTILTVPQFPGEDKKLRATKLSHRRGGNCANSLEVLEQLVRNGDDAHSGRSESYSYPLYLLAVLPDPGSTSVRTIKESLRHTKLDPTCIYRESVNDAASSYIIRSEETGSRTIVSYNELEELTLQEFKQRAYLALSDSGSKCAWFHFEGRTPEVVLSCLKFLRSDNHFENCRVSIELEKPDRKLLVEAAKEADVVFYSKIWAEAHGHTSARNFLETQLSITEANALLCCTWGSCGVTAIQKGYATNVEWADVKAWSLDEATARVVDATGAGDTFIAGMIYALTHHRLDWTLRQQVSFANELAGRKVFQDGFKGLGSQYRAAHGGAIAPPITDSPGNSAA